MSKAFRFHRHGGPDVLRFEDVEVGTPGPGQVRIRNTAVAVNYRDVLMRSGIHAVKSFPSGIGLESAGVIEAVGPGGRLASLSATASPMRACRRAPTREQRIVPAARLIALPDGIDERTAASMMIRGMTARTLLFDAYKVQPGDTILIHAAAGGVGLIVCQWAKHLGATVIGTVSSDEKAAVARAHGCDHAIVYTREDFAARVREITGGEGVPVVYDSVGKATFEGSLKCLRRRGVMASFGEASGDPDPMPPRRLGALGSIYLTHPSVSNYTVDAGRAHADRRRSVRDGGQRQDQDRDQPAYPLRDAPRAHADIEARKTTGSIVLVGRQGRFGRRRAAHSVRSPPPCGEGLGVGVMRCGNARAYVASRPLPALPAGGRDAPRSWHAIDKNAAQIKSSAALRPSPPPAPP